MHTVQLCAFSHVESHLGAGVNSLVQGDLEVEAGGEEGDTLLVESRNGG